MISENNKYLTVFGRKWDSYLSLSIPMEPVAKARARVTRWGVHTPEKTKVAQKHIASAFEDAFSNDDEWPYKLDCPVLVVLRLYHKRPKRLCRKIDPVGPILKTTKPDKDNLEKLVNDALNDAGVWIDDKVNTTSITQKEYVALGDQPRVEIYLYIPHEI